MGIDEIKKDLRKIFEYLGENPDREDDVAPSRHEVLENPVYPRPHAARHYRSQYYRSRRRRPQPLSPRERAGLYEPSPRP